MMTPGSDAAGDPPAHAIAILGMSGRFPGAADVEAFWSNLCAGVDSIARWGATETGLAAASGQWVQAGGELSDMDLFDAAHFGIGRREAEIMDPQHRLFLECASEALAAAALDPERFEGLIGVYGGCGLNTYFLNQLQANPAALAAVGGFQAVIANEKDSLATQTAYRLNLKGPAMTVQTACSTSLAAVQTACQALLSYQCDAALAGGATLRVPARSGYLYQEGGILSPDGRCRAFSADANGTVSGSGVGVVALRRLEDALASGDPIVAVIRGSAINNDGADKVGYAAPGLNGQAAVIALALAQAGIDPRQIGYVEAHGTGTALGDPVEVAALTRVFGPTATAWCALGSVKPNVGHLDAAAGVAGLIKAACAVQRGRVPPSLYAEPTNPHIDFAKSPFYLNTRLRDWTGPTPRRAGVSSFGIGGTNVHLVIEEPPPRSGQVRSRDAARVWHRERFWVEREVPERNGASADARTGGDRLEDLIYFSSWRKEPASGSMQPANAGRERWLVLSEDRIFPDALRADGHDVIWVAPGSPSRPREAGRVDVDPRSPEDFRKLAGHLKAGDPIRVLHAWCLPAACPVGGGAGGFGDWQAAGFYGLLHLVQALGAEGILGRADLTVLASGVFSVTGAEPLDPAKATLAGLIRVIPQEYPGVSCRMMDVELPPDGAAAGSWVSATLARLGSRPSGPASAWRGGTCWVPAYPRVPAHPRVLPVLREGGVYLITGGLGKIGLALAEFLAARYRAKLVLVGRTPLPPRDQWERAASVDNPGGMRIGRLLRMEAGGAEVLAIAADVSDEASARDLLRKAEERFGAVHGLIHAAGDTGEAAFQPIARADVAGCENQFRPKARGIEAIARAFEGRRLDFCVLMSSLSTVLGGLGFGAYAAANAYLDAFAESMNRTSAYPWLSIAWDGWGFGGTAGLAPADGVSIFERLMDRRQAGGWIVATGDLEGRLHRSTAASRIGSRAEPGNAPSRRNDPAEVEAVLIQIWREVLGAADPDPETHFFEAGGDSLSGVQLISLVNQRLGCSVPASALYETPTIRSLAQTLCRGTAGTGTGAGRRRGEQRRERRRDGGSS